MDLKSDHDAMLNYHPYDRLTFRGIPIYEVREVRYMAAGSVTEDE